MFAPLPTGKRPFVTDSRDLKLSKYLDKVALIDKLAAPMNPDWTTMLCPDGNVPPPDRDPLYNNVAGCCVYSAPGHKVNLVGKLTGRPDLVVTAAMVRDAYARATGYDPATGAGDNGWWTREMLKEWRNVGLYGTRLRAFAAVNPRDPEEVALACTLAGGLIGGYSLPATIWDQGDDSGRMLWTVPEGGFPAGQGPGSAGGHCIFDPAARGGNTWGIRADRTQEWDDQCCDELWLPLMAEWETETGRAPNGFAYADLLADAAARG
jgi:hypothetical protein